MQTGMLTIIALAVSTSLCAVAASSFTRSNVFNNKRQNNIILMMGIAATLWNMMSLGYSIATDVKVINICFYMLIAAFDMYVVSLCLYIGKLVITAYDEEFAEIKKHPVIGSEILMDISEMPDIQVGARWHHEKYDGSGYPDRLEGNDISEIARIIGVADAYDAMTSTRSYRDCLSQDIVREEIIRGKGKQFDPKFADIMIEIIDEDKEYRLHE